MLADDRCGGCAKENRPCQYKGRASSRRRCSHYEAKLNIYKKKDNKAEYVDWFNRHMNKPKR